MKCEWALDLQMGIGWVRHGPLLVQVKFPWAYPTFSERYGHKKPRTRIFGLRLFVEREHFRLRRVK